MAEKWEAHETRVYTGDGGFDLRGAPNAVERAKLVAAAPDLLKCAEVGEIYCRHALALLLVEGSADEQAKAQRHLDFLQTTIAKAEGRS